MPHPFVLVVPLAALIGIAMAYERSASFNERHGQWCVMTPERGQAIQALRAGSTAAR